ncbi:hypothetical protein B1222_15480 [Paenibacillus larvae subsp. pulvifaciens]|nr:hypothetical protein B1222_15480 [Paenibacillus larvae subsp. pulvifaciens]
MAAQAADMIEEGNTLLLDAGTTTFYLAKN